MCMRRRLQSRGPCWRIVRAPRHHLHARHVPAPMQPPPIGADHAPVADVEVDGREAVLQQQCMQRCAREVVEVLELAPERVAAVPVHCPATSAASRHTPHTHRPTATTRSRRWAWRGTAGRPAAAAPPRAAVRHGATACARAHRPSTAHRICRCEPQSIGTCTHCASVRSWLKSAHAAWYPAGVTASTADDIITQGDKRSDHVRPRIHATRRKPALRRRAEQHTAAAAHVCGRDGGRWARRRTEPAARVVGPGVASCEHVMQRCSCACACKTSQCRDAVDNGGGRQALRLDLRM